MQTNQEELDKTIDDLNNTGPDRIEHSISELTLGPTITRPGSAKSVSQASTNYSIDLN